MQGERIRIHGLVQGVGFRPTVWRLARAAGLSGDVINDGRGVLINAWGSRAALDTFCARLLAECPPLARIDTIRRDPLDTRPDNSGQFVIAPSRTTSVHTGIVPDAATCSACRTEILDPQDRRYRYPFTNCTHCGPRLSIIRRIPYDRAHTSMAAFTLCAHCQAEYDDPADRRFHAQPNACAACGPRLWLVDAHGAALEPQAQADAVALCAQLLRQGAIVAIKGIGGFHLACDAANRDAVASLRQRKGRDAKPFALMCADTRDAAAYVYLAPSEEALLLSPAAPIVLAARRPDGAPLSDLVAPGQDSLGIMLPYSPLHHLLMHDWQALRPGIPLVMTSGNRTQEPQCIANDEAIERLAAIADYWLLHDREIVNRVDDSVARVDHAGIVRLLRRARGYAPAPMPLPLGFEGAPPLIALGAELKNTFCLVRDDQFILSQHFGDLEDARGSDAWEQGLDLYRQLFGLQPGALAVDLHPDYRSTRAGRTIAERDGLTLIGVQHHHAHIASVLAEHAWPRDRGKVLGIALDGLGFGTDGTLWGGEFLLADYHACERLARLRPIALPGATRALQEPWRNTWSYLATELGWDTVRRDWADLELVQWLRLRPVETLQAMCSRGLNSPLSSACGRLFDAVAGALDICRERISYEGQAAIMLENAARQAPAESAAYPFAIGQEAIASAPMWRALLADLRDGVEQTIIAARFHNGLARALSELGTALCARHDLHTVALSGGVMQNRTLLHALQQQLAAHGIEVLSNRLVPSNDGGIALGQAAIAAARLCRDA